MLTGGDSGMPSALSHVFQIPVDQPSDLLTMSFYSYRKSKSMVHLRRSGLHHHSLGYGRGHDTGSRLLVFRPCAKKVGPEHDLGLYG